MTDDPQAMTAGPRTAEGDALLKWYDEEFLSTPAEQRAMTRRVRRIEDAAFAQGVAAARAAVAGLPRTDVVLIDIADILDALAALDSTDRP